MVIAIREDYLGELEPLAAPAPAVMRKRIRLREFTRPQATLAIEGPEAASVPGAITDAFEWSGGAVAELLDFLCRKRLRGRNIEGNTVEPSQLSVICGHVEGKVRQRQRNRANRTVKTTTRDLGGPGLIASAGDPRPAIRSRPGRAPSS